MKRDETILVGTYDTCPKGHAYSGRNAKGYLVCRICHEEAKVRYLQRKNGMLIPPIDRFRPLDKRFWAKVGKSAGADECWLWKGRSSDRYGALRVNGSRIQAHRISYELNIGPIPDGLCVLHRCDNPPCVNPAHLFLGTRGDNIRDCTAKGRHGALRRKESGRARLTTAEVQEIRRMSVSHREIAKQFGIDDGHVGKIKRGEVWRRLLAEVGGE